MKKLIPLFMVACLCMAAVPASAQLRFGVKLGTNISHLSFSKDVFNSSNIAGFTGGIMAEFTAPIIGIGMDASVMYARKGAKLDVTQAPGDDINRMGGKTKQHLDYIDIPINLKWKYGISLAKIFFTVGPDFGFLVGNNLIEAARDKKFNFGINLGGGVELFSRVQIAAQYGWGLTKAVDIAGDNAKNRNVQITAAYLF